MLIDEVLIDERFINLLKSDGISNLYPVQKQVVESGILDSGNLVLSTPTASGKTLAAEIVMAKALERGRGAVYIVPLRALAFEKYREFRRYEKLGYSVRIETGDLDSNKYKKRSKFDILVATAEKCDSLLRSGAGGFENIGVLIMDEIHLIATDRGPVYEIIISKFRKLFPEIQILALSATIGNSIELSDWLNAKLIESEWRPVKLAEDVVVGAEKYEKLKEITRNSIYNGGQVLIFANSRNSSENIAEKLAYDPGLITPEYRKEVMETGKEILNSLSSPTKQCKRLSECVKGGTAFHHAGLVNRQRTIVEESFRNGLIKVIVATPTLAAGVNLPSRTVIIKDIKRYDNGGMKYIPVLEYKQQIGRAGRPKYDRIGEAITIAKTESEREFLIEKYVNGKIEDIYSQLGIEPVLRFHMLAVIASNFARTRKSLIEFFGSTFFGYQYGIGGDFEDLIERIIRKLIDWNFVGMDGKFIIPTTLGSRVSELYIDPLTAFNYIKILRTAEEKNSFAGIGILEMLCDAVEMPLLRIKRSEESLLWGSACSESEKILRDLDGFGLDGNFLERYKTAKLLESWTCENSEEKILEDYNVAPGILHQRIQIAEWLAYSAGEISGILNLPKSKREMKKMEIRIKDGIKEELIPLVGIRGIGRARARRLFNAGFKNPNDVKKADLKVLGRIIGEKTAEAIRAEIM